MANGSAWRLDPERIGIGGGSAGAVTVLFYGYADRAASEGNSGSPGFSSEVRVLNSQMANLGKNTRHNASQRKNIQHNYYFTDAFSCCHGQVRFVMPVSGELRYDAFCKGGLDPVTKAPIGCHYGTWDYTNQINATRHPKQPPLLIVHGTDDTIVPFREATAMLTQANATGLSPCLLLFIVAVMNIFMVLLIALLVTVSLIIFIVVVMNVYGATHYAPV